MKRLFISMMALVAIVSCSKESAVETPGGSVDALTFKASFENAGSRVSVSEEGGAYKMAWSSNDELAIYTRKTKTRYTYDPTNDVFTKSGFNSGPSLTTHYYAAFPYGSASQAVSDEGVISMDLPAVQQYAENSFGPTANSMVAVCPIPDVEAGTAVPLSFMNVCGYLKLCLYGDNTSVTSIEFSGNNSETISGGVNVAIAEGAEPTITWTSTNGKSIALNCAGGVKVGSTPEEATPFWLVVPPTSFEKGFKVRITSSNGAVMVKSLDEAFEIKRNTVETMAALELEFPKVDANILMDITFNEDGTASDNGKYFFSVVTRPGSNLSVIDDEDYPYGKVAKFTNCDGLKNRDLMDSFYSIDYSSAEDFKANLTDADGFTLEMVVKHGIQSRSDQYPWQNPATSNTFGFFQKGTDSGNNAGWVATRRSTNENNTSPFDAGDNMYFAPCLNQYYHYAYVYDKVNSKVVMYCDGEPINEVAGVTEISAGKYFAIGGFPISEAAITHAFTGNVAMVRIYASAITAEQAKAHYEALNIPSKAAAVGTPMFDAKFKADGTAENVGSANLTIETVADANVLSTKQYGAQYVAAFHRDSKNNNKANSGFYYVDYSQNADYINKLKDGYTMEVVCLVKRYAGDYWSKVFCSTTAGIHHVRVDQDSSPWGGFGNTPENNWGTGIGWNWPKNYLWGSNVLQLDTYYHLVLVWNAESNVFTLYENGKYGHSSYTSPVDANVGSRLAIGGLPCPDKTVYHPFVGEIAIARVYDETMTHKQVIERYEELQPTFNLK